jgi:hypothetical protein
MYFAAILFNLTLLTAAVVSLSTPADESYRVSQNNWPDISAMDDDVSLHLGIDSKNYVHVFVITYA